MGSQGVFLGQITDDAESDKRRTASRAELRGLVERQGYKCALSGVQLDPDIAELDHIVPVAAGGWHDVGNLQVLHRAINRMKGQLSNDEFIRWCRLVAETEAAGLPLPGGFGSLSKPDALPAVR